MTAEGPSPQRSGRDKGSRDKGLKYTASGAAFLIGFAILMILMLPNPWALAAGTVVGAAAAAGTYGTIYGRELNLQRRSIKVSSVQSTMTNRLKDLQSLVRNQSNQFPPSTHGQLRMIVVGLEEIVQRWSTLDRAPEQQDAVYRTITRDAPRTLELFIGLPDTAKPDHAQEFKAQVSLLAEAVAKTRDRVVANDLNALKTNRWLLEEALTDPDERLFKEHGL